MSIMEYILVFIPENIDSNNIGFIIILVFQFLFYLLALIMYWINNLCIFLVVPYIIYCLLLFMGMSKDKEKTVYGFIVMFLPLVFYLLDNVILKSKSDSPFSVLVPLGIDDDSILGIISLYKYDVLFGIIVKYLRRNKVKRITFKKDVKNKKDFLVIMFKNYKRELLICFLLILGAFGMFYCSLFYYELFSNKIPFDNEYYSSCTSYNDTIAFKKHNIAIYFEGDDEEDENYTYHYIYKKKTHELKFYQKGKYLFSEKVVNVDAKSIELKGKFFSGVYLKKCKKPNDDE